MSVFLLTYFTGRGKRFVGSSLSVLAWRKQRSRLLITAIQLIKGRNGSFSICNLITNTERGRLHVGDGCRGADIATSATAPACSSNSVLVYLRSGEEALALWAYFLFGDLYYPVVFRQFQLLASHPPMRIVMF